MVEVIGQPATRIGAGPPLSSQTGTRPGDLVGFAAFPLAISNTEFARIASTAAANTNCVVNLSPSAPSTPLSIKGCLVNLAAGNGSNFYGNANSDFAVSELLGLLNYFGAKSAQQTRLPAVVERGSQLSAFNPNNAAFLKRVTQVTTSLNQVVCRGTDTPLHHCCYQFRPSLCRH